MFRILGDARVTALSPEMETIPIQRLQCRSEAAFSAAGWKSQEVILQRPDQDP